MASVFYNTAKKEIMDGTVDLVNDVIKVMLVTSSYVVNPDHLFVDDGGANDPIDHELSGTGYAAGFAGSGRKTLASKVFTTDQANDRAELDVADVVWTAINAGTAAAFIIYKHLTSDALSRLIAYVDTGGFSIVTNGGDLTIQINAEGIIQLT